MGAGKEMFTALGTRPLLSPELISLFRFYLNFVTEEVIKPTRYLTSVLIYFFIFLIPLHSSVIFPCYRTIPAAIIFSMVTVTVFYVLVNVAYYTMMSPAELLQSEAVAVVSDAPRRA